ncbi:SPASM domain-containing protein [Bremerella sp. JC770]|uniref:SPASM domain-containing protein n=1 Tax=Bremerella sp. JC770 TaxID=3232137 RepID=UPI00345A5971
MTRLKYDPWILSLQLIDASGPRRIMMTPDRLSGILCAGRRIDTIHTVHVRGVGADPGELAELVDHGRMIALTGFAERVLFTSGEGMMRQEVEEVFRAFTTIEFSLPVEVRNQLLSFSATSSEQLIDEIETWLRTIEYYARVKSAWQLSSELVVRIPQGNLPVDLADQLDQLSWRHAFRVQRSGGASAFSLEQQQADYGMKLCEEPYRVMTFGACGQMTGCSGQQRQRVYFGSLEEDSLRGLWEGPSMESWRKNRTDSQCQGCPGLGSTLRRPSLISIYDSVGEQRFHEYPQQQLRKIADESEGQSSSRSASRTIFCSPRKAS